MRETPWWLGLPPAEFDVPCRGARHRVRWADGRLEPLEHEDAAAERVLVALSGEKVGCYETMAAWARHAGDVRLLTLGPRSDQDVMHAGRADIESLERQMEAISDAKASLKGRGTGGGGRGAPGPGRAGPVGIRTFALLAGVLSADHLGWRSQAELLGLFTLPRPVLDRLLLEAWATRSGDLRRAAARYGRALTGGGVAGDGPAAAADGPALFWAAAARVAATVREWLEGDTRFRGAAVRTELVAGDSPLELTPSPDGRVDRLRFDVAVGSDWLAEVWGRQMGVVDGHLVGELVDLDGERAMVRALVPGGGTRQAASRVQLVRRPDVDAWMVAAI